MTALKRCMCNVHINDIGVYHLKFELLLSGCKEVAIVGNVAALKRCLM